MPRSGGFPSCALCGGELGRLDCSTCNFDINNSMIGKLEFELDPVLRVVIIFVKEYTFMISIITF